MFSATPSTRMAALLACSFLWMFAAASRAGSLEASTRISQADQVYWVEQIAEGLNFPSSMAWLPNGDMLVTERMGGLRQIRAGQLDSKPVDGVPPSFPGLFDGLRDVVVDPDFPSNHWIYLAISEGTADERRCAVYRARYSAAGLNDVVRIFSSQESVGGYTAGVVVRMTFLVDKTLLISIGERGPRAQQLSTHLGKVLRINREGSAPADNPFLNTPGALPEIWTYGHRGVLGLYQDIQTRSIWEVESGPRGGDELNELKAGANYGWNKMSWGFTYNNQGSETPQQSGPGIENPVLIWTPSVTPSGITRYSGNAYPLWKGDFFIGYLTARALGRLRFRDHRLALEERLLLDLEERIRDVRVGPDDRLYVLTDHQNARILRLQPGRPRATDADRVAKKSKQEMSWSSLDSPSGNEAEIENLTEGDLVKGQAGFLERCAACHRIGASVEGGSIGPDLTDAYGNFMGRRAGFDYSANMAFAAFVWNYATLNAFLANPNGFVPGTRMTAPPVTDAQMRRNIIGFLKRHSTKMDQ